MKIGNVTLENNIFLAPMAGVTDLPFRLLCKKQGAGLVYTEMISSKALFYGDEKTKKLMHTIPEERPLAIQLFGSEIEAMREATKQVTKFADIIDINMGCPAPKVVKNGDGSKLLLDLDLAENIVKAVVAEATVPVTVKIRKGWDAEHIVAVEAAQRFEKAGAAAITIHGRTRSEFYTGTADWECIKQVKQAVKIPVIGNGDVTTPEDAKRMLEETKVDAIMIGRASFGNPWIFKEILTYLQTGEKAKQPTIQEKLEMIITHIELEVEEKGENAGVREIRKQIGWYLKNLKESSKAREKINQIENKEELINYLKEYFKSL